MMIALAIGLAALVVAYLLDLFIGTPLELPAFFVSFYDTLFEYIYDGLGILDFFCPVEYIKVIFGIWVALHALYFTYSVARWAFGAVR